LKFDYIIGNPPYQDISKNSKGRKLYLFITEKMINKFNEEMIFLTPKQISNIKKKRFELSKLNNVKFIDFDVDKYFNVGVEIILFQLTNYKVDKIKIKENNNIYYSKLPLKKDEIIPTIMFNKIKDLGSKQEDKLFIGDVTSNGNEDENGKYKIIINYIKNKIRYTNVKPKLYKKKKVVIHMGKVYNENNFLISYDDYGQYQNMIDLTNYNEDDINNLKLFLFHPIVTNLVKKFRIFYGTGFNNIIYFFRKYNKNKLNNYIKNNKLDDFIIDYFKLNKEELNYLFSNDIKLKSKNIKDEKKNRSKETGEIFTPKELVNYMLDLIEYKWDKSKTFLDPTCGNGNILVEIAKRGEDPKNIFGVDLFEDNIIECKNRLKKIYLEHKYDIDYINKYLDKNIKVENALEFDYNFNQKLELF